MGDEPTEGVTDASAPQEDGRLPEPDDEQLAVGVRRDADGTATIVFGDGFEVDYYACPRRILFDRDHYRGDGSCKCPESEK